MSSLENSPVTLGVDAGGKDADEATKDHYMALRRALAAECAGPYGRAFDEFALVLRIDGSVVSWKKRGVANVRLQRKSRYATADVFVPATVWKAVSSKKFRTFLAEEVEAAVRAITDRAMKAKDDIDDAELLAGCEPGSHKVLEVVR
jgi:hypothetical protein